MKITRPKILLGHKVTKPTKVVFGLVYISVLVITVYHVYYAKKIIPGVEISGIGVGGLTFIEARSVLLENLKNTDLTLRMRYQDQTFDFSSQDLTVDYNIDATVARAFEIGRTGNLLIDSKDKVAGLLKPLRLKNFYTVDDATLDSTLSTIEGELNKSPQNAQYKLENGELLILPSTGGKKVDDQLLYEKVVTGLDDMDFSAKDIVVKEVAPNVSEAHLQTHLGEVKAITEKPITFKNGDLEWKLTPEQVLNLLEVTIDEDGNSQVILDNPSFESFVELLAQEVNELPRGKVTEVKDNKVVKFELTKEGNELDIPALKNDLRASLFTNISPEINLPLIKLSGPSDPEKYGILELLGEGESQYTGSASSRIHNLSLAAERTDGVLVPPDSIYSFNNSVGDISAKTGYATAYIISNGRTVLGDGGGVCQTSTTLFRAVLNSGLPVVKRHPHAYRVKYYELDKPAGFDASVYQPSLDFQFKNDTEGYVLVQLVEDPDNDKLKFQLYGTPDGRTVAITEPVISNQTPPPAALYQDDPTLQKGVTKQVDWSAWGATAAFDRTVTKANGEIVKDTFTTRYQPWRAVFLVGTKE